MKYCPKCEQSLPLGDFYRSSKSSDGRAGYCRVCSKVANQKYHADNKDSIAMRKQVWRELHPEDYAARVQRSNNLPSTKKRKALRWRRWKAEMNDRKAHQDNRCLDCNEQFEPHRLHFDHVDPSTKRWNPSHGCNQEWGEAVVELEKCEIVCVSCHGKRTAARRAA